MDSETQTKYYEAIELLRSWLGSAPSILPREQNSLTGNVYEQPYDLLVDKTANFLAYNAPKDREDK